MLSVDDAVTCQLTYDIVNVYATFRPKQANIHAVSTGI